MIRIMAGFALVALLGWAIYYNVRAQTAPSPRAAAKQASPSNTSPLTPPVNPTPTERTLTVVGALRAEREAAISSRNAGRIVAVLVRDGQVVTQGQTLVRLDLGDVGAQVAGSKAGVLAAEAQYRKAVDGKRARDVEMSARITEANAGLRTALAKERQAEIAIRLNQSSTSSENERALAAVRQAEAGLRQAETGHKQATDTLKRLQFLYSRGGIPRADLEGAEAQVDIAKAQRDAAVAALDQARAAATPAAETSPLRRQVSEADLEAARAGVQQAREGLDSARRSRIEALRIADRDIEAARAQVAQAQAGRRQEISQVGSNVLTAPFAGIVTELSARSGEVAQPGQSLMTLIAPESVRLEASVPARYARHVRVGTPAKVRLDTDPGRALRGRVDQVLPVSSDGTSLPLRIRFFGSKFLPGIVGRAEITLMGAD